MRKNLFHSDFKKFELEVGKKLMESEIKDIDFKHEIRLLFHYAWIDFENNKFSYDGPTFVRSRFKQRWEIASFIHDWRNSQGNVGKAIDDEFFAIMITLNYPLKFIITRWFFTRLTFINVWRHKILGTYKNYINVRLYKL